jgi:hypothetical protein
MTNVIVYETRVSICQRCHCSSFPAVAIKASPLLSLKFSASTVPGSVPPPSGRGTSIRTPSIRTGPPHVVESNRLIDGKDPLRLAECTSYCFIVIK